MESSQSCSGRASPRLARHRSPSLRSPAARRSTPPGSSSPRCASISLPTASTRCSSPRRFCGVDPGRQTPAYRAQRRPRLRADQSLRAFRASFCGDCRRRSAGRPGAGGADGLPARYAVDPRWRRLCRRSAGYDRPVPLDPPRRTFARRHGALGDGAGGWRHRRHRHPANHDHPARCSGAGCG